MVDQDVNALVSAEIERRLSDPTFLRTTLIALNEKVRSLENELETVAPKTDFYDAVVASDDWMDMAAAVKVLAFKGYGRNKVFELLRERQVFRYNNEPYQQYIERGYFRTTEERFNNPKSGDAMVYRKTMVSQRGLDFIRKIITEA